MGEYDDLIAAAAPNKPPGDDYADLISAASDAAPRPGPAGLPRFAVIDVPGVKREQSFGERLGEGLTNIGRTVKAGASTLFGHSPLAAAINAPEGQRLSAAGSAFTSQFADPSKRREYLRGLDQMVTLGYGQRLAGRAGRALGDAPGVDLQATADSDRAAAPGYREAGGLVGMVSPGAASAAGKAGGKLVSLATKGAKPSSALGAAALGATKGGAGYLASAPATAALSADAEGKRLQTLEEAATDPAGLVLATGLGAGGGIVQRVVETAPRRVLKRAGESITTGEQNAKKKVTQKVAERLGDDNERFADLAKREPEIEKALAVDGATKPGKALKVIAAKGSDIDDALDGLYADMEKLGRVVSPADITREFDALVGERLAAGQLDAVKVLRKARGQFVEEYGNFGKLSGDTMRGLKRSASTAAFSGDTAVPPDLRTQASRDIWGVYSRAIERQAEGSGVDVKKLRQLNTDRSLLIPMEAALKERAQMGQQGRKSIGEHITQGAAVAAGLAGGHGVAGLATAVAVPAALKVAKQAGRRIDYEIARRTGGQVTDRTAASGARAGKLAYAARVSEGMKRGLSLKEAVEAAGEEE